jgi:hypothetical protein
LDARKRPTEDRVLAVAHTGRPTPRTHRLGARIDDVDSERLGVVPRAVESDRCRVLTVGRQPAQNERPVDLQLREPSSVPVLGNFNFDFEQVGQHSGMQH